MDIITQLQEQTNHVASQLFNFVGTLQRDAPPVALDESSKENRNRGAVKKEGEAGGEAAPIDIEEQTKEMAKSVVQAVKLFDAMVKALPSTSGGEAAQLERIRQLEAEKEAAGEKIARELLLSEEELRRVSALFRTVTDDCLSLQSRPSIP
eukprot:TRINITY_DN17047_c0_g1_i1.p1 TRINITY_DN17047_c0_g1~~TRINITY_DN17047_c0_g1_i1.p1  ORF type:complete len:151 (+),score=30.14 TRINITY_DN17047_c0_g1_i1:247-699(+)